MELPKTLKGFNRTLEIFEDKVKITPRWLAKYFIGSKEIQFSSITAIEFKEAKLLSYGYIDFTIPGQSEKHRDNRIYNPNTFLFGMNLNKEMKIVKEFIDGKISKKKNSLSGEGISNELEKLSKLKNDGVISEEEFKELKKNIIKKAS